MFVHKVKLCVQGSLFQALDQWGRSKKRERDERGLVVVRFRLHFSIVPTVQEPGAGYNEVNKNNKERRLGNIVLHATIR